MFVSVHLASISGILAFVCVVLYTWVLVCLCVHCASLKSMVCTCDSTCLCRVQMRVALVLLPTEMLSLENHVGVPLGAPQQKRGLFCCFLLSAFDLELFPVHIPVRSKGMFLPCSPSPRTVYFCRSSGCGSLSPKTSFASACDGARTIVDVR